MSMEGAAGLPDSVNIEAVQAETQRLFDLHQVLASEELVVGGKLVDVQLRSVATEPTIDGEANGKRVMFGIFVRTGQQDAFVQVVRGPLRFSVERWEYPAELAQEKRILELIGKAPVTPLVVRPILGALQTNEAIYEATAPGVSLFNVLHIVSEACLNGEISEQEAALLVTKLQASSRQALVNLHSIGIKHYHPDMENFNVDLETGDVTIFDYTFAVSKFAKDTEIPTKERRLTADDLGEDIDEFERSMRSSLSYLRMQGVASLAEYDAAEMDAAIAKLQPIVISRALRTLKIGGFSEEDIREIIAVQDRLIGMAPAVEYPQSTFGRRLKARLAAARVALQDFVKYGPR